MEIFLKVILRILKCMVMEFLPVVMEMSIMVSGFIIQWKEKVLAYRQMVILIMAYGKKMNVMDRVIIYGKMVTNTKENGKKIEEKVLVNFI